MDLGIRGKTALVLAAAGGLGSAIANALADEGVHLALADVDEAGLERVTETLRGPSTNVVALPWNLADLSQVEASVSRIESELGGVDILVNITGGPPPTPAAGQDPQLWRRGFEDMVLSVISIADRVLPRMRAKRWGRIITSTSSGVIVPIPNLAISNSLRLSLVGWSKSLALEVAGDGVTANVIVPGRIATGRIHYLDEQKAARDGKSVEEVVTESTSSIPIRRYGRPEEYAAVVVFLASVRASYVTGSVVRVDGGLIACN
jgi:3-oxoacyl-[acyl-carrier protein] reductase